MDTTIGKYVKNWNALDTTIYFIEVLASKITRRIREEIKEPDVEEIIMVETQHLQDELTYYKSHQRPGELVAQRDGYLCPECGKRIAAELVEKFQVKHCPECGKRITRHKPLPFTVRDNLEG